MASLYIGRDPLELRLVRPFARSVSGICQKPFNKSNLETYFAVTIFRHNHQFTGLDTYLLWLHYLVFIRFGN